MVIYPYTPASFLTPIGALGKARQLKRKGFPQNLRNWRFLTLTIDRTQYEDAESAYIICTRHLRQFVYDLREMGYNFDRYCWKLEFHKPDPKTGEVWPHWHMLIDYKRPIPREIIEGCWGKGRVNVKGVKNEGFDYLFKYMAKSIDEIPQWVLDMKRIRCFQSSRGFFPKQISASDGVAKNETASPRQVGDGCARDTQNDRFRNETIGERLERHQHTVVSRIQCDDLTFRHTLHLNPFPTWGALLVSISRVMFSAKIDPNKMNITHTKIETSCLQYLPPVFSPASS